MPHQKTYAINEQDNRKVLNIRCGGHIRIELEMLGGAGYSWHIDDLNTECLELVSEEVSDVSGEKVGGPVPKIGSS